MTPRIATSDDLPQLVRLINLAYQAEAFFKIGDRTDLADLGAYFARGTFLILDHPTQPVVACIFLEKRGTRAYFGLLSVDPGFQGQRLGTQLVSAAEDWGRAAGCLFLDIQVVNLRRELPGYYRSLGFCEYDIAPFPETEKLSRTAHFVKMTKPLGPLFAE